MWCRRPSAFAGGQLARSVLYGHFTDQKLLAEAVQQVEGLAGQRGVQQGLRPGQFGHDGLSGLDVGVELDRRVGGDLTACERVGRQSVVVDGGTDPVDGEVELVGVEDAVADAASTGSARVVPSLMVTGIMKPRSLPRNSSNCFQWAMP